MEEVDHLGTAVPPQHPGIPGQLVVVPEPDRHVGLPRLRRPQLPHPRPGRLLQVEAVEERGGHVLPRPPHHVLERLHHLGLLQAGPEIDRGAGVGDRLELLGPDQGAVEVEEERADHDSSSRRLATYSRTAATTVEWLQVRGLTESGSPVNGWTCSAMIPLGRVCPATHAKISSAPFRSPGSGGGDPPLGEPEGADEPGVPGDVVRHPVVGVALVAGHPADLGLHPEPLLHRAHGGGDARIVGREHPEVPEPHERGVDGEVGGEPSVRPAGEHAGESPLLLGPECVVTASRISSAERRQSAAMAVSPNASANSAAAASPPTPPPPSRPSPPGAPPRGPTREAAGGRRDPGKRRASRRPG